MIDRMSQSRFYYILAQLGLIRIGKENVLFFLISDWKPYKYLKWEPSINYIRNFTCYWDPPPPLLRFACNTQKKYIKGLTLPLGAYVINGRPLDEHTTKFF